MYDAFDTRAEASWAPKFAASFPRGRSPARERKSLVTLLHTGRMHKYTVYDLHISMTP